MRTSQKTPHRQPSLLQAVLFLLLGTLLPLGAQSQLIDSRYSKEKNTSIRVTALASQLPTTGFLPVRAEIRNDEAQAKTWTFNASTTAYIYNYRSYRMSNDDHETVLNSDFQLTVEPGKEAVFDFMVPVPALYETSHGGGSEASATLNLIITAPGLAKLETSIHTQVEEDWPSVLISNDLYNVEKITLDRIINTSGSRGGVEFGAAFDPKLAPTSWKAYLGYEFIIMTAEEWMALSAAARGAILNAIRLGNHLQILHRDSEVTAKTLGIKLDDEALGKISAPYGFGRVQLTPITTERPYQPTPFIANIRSRDDSRISALSEDFTNPRNPLQSTLGEKNFNIGLVLLVLIAFGIVVGPVNLFVFTKGGNRHRLFITTPLISLAASLLLILIIVFQDGFGGTGHRVALVQIQAADGENSAYFQQEQIARTGMLFGSKSQSDDQFWLGSYLLPASRWSRVNHQNLGAGQTYRIQNAENGTLLEGDWFQSRSEQAHYLTGMEPTRGRIELSNQNGPPTIRSTFDFPLETLWFRAPDGSLWRAKNVTNAGAITLQPVSSAEWVQWKDATAGQFGPTLNQNFLALSQRNGWFFATTSEAPMVETLGSIDWETSLSVLTGPVVQP